MQYIHTCIYECVFILSPYETLCCHCGATPTAFNELQWYHLNQFNLSVWSLLGVLVRQTAGWATERLGLQVSTWRLTGQDAAAVLSQPEPRHTSACDTDYETELFGLAASFLPKYILFFLAASLAQLHFSVSLSHIITKFRFSFSDWLWQDRGEQLADGGVFIWCSRWSWEHGRDLSQSVCRSRKCLTAARAL